MPMLSIKQKTITRTEWPRVSRKTFTWMPLDLSSLRGVAALIRLDEVTSPRIGTSCGESVVIADTGYYWVQVAPENAHWWLTFMADPNGRIYQYYFDVTLCNRIDGANTSFDDLFLDVVALPNGRCESLDSDELDEALASGIISFAQHEMARTKGAKLMRDLPLRIHDLNRFADNLFSQLLREMEQH